MEDENIFALRILEETNGSSEHVILHASSFLRTPIKDFTNPNPTRMNLPKVGCPKGAEQSIYY